MNTCNYESYVIDTQFIILRARAFVKRAFKEGEGYAGMELQNGVLQLYS